MVNEQRDADLCICNDGSVREDIECSVHPLLWEKPKPKPTVSEAEIDKACAAYKAIPFEYGSEALLRKRLKAVLEAVR